MIYAIIPIKWIYDMHDDTDIFCDAGGGHTYVGGFIHDVIVF